MSGADFEQRRGAINPWGSARHYAADSPSGWTAPNQRGTFPSHASFNIVPGRTIHPRYEAPSVMSAVDDSSENLVFTMSGSENSGAPATRRQQSQTEWSTPMSFLKRVPPQVTPSFHPNLNREDFKMVGDPNSMSSSYGQQAFSHPNGVPGFEHNFYVHEAPHTTVTQPNSFKDANSAGKTHSLYGDSGKYASGHLGWDGGAPTGTHSSSHGFSRGDPMFARSSRPYKVTNFATSARGSFVDEHHSGASCTPSEFDEISWGAGRGASVPEHMPLSNQPTFGQTKNGFNSDWGCGQAEQSVAQSKLLCDSGCWDSCPVHKALGKSTQSQIMPGLSRLDSKSKPEPHGKSEIESGRWNASRNISDHDELVHHLRETIQNQAETINAYRAKLDNRSSKPAASSELPNAPEAMDNISQESSVAMCRLELQMMSMSTDITKMKMYHKFSRMQQDSDRLARIEQQLASHKVFEDDRRAIDSTHEMENLRASVEHLKDAGRREMPHSDVQSQMRAISERIEGLEESTRCLNRGSDVQDRLDGSKSPNDNRGQRWQPHIQGHNSSDQDNAATSHSGNTWGVANSSARSQQHAHEGWSAPKKGGWFAVSASAHAVSALSEKSNVNGAWGMASNDDWGNAIHKSPRIQINEAWTTCSRPQQWSNNGWGGNNNNVYCNSPGWNPDFCSCTGCREISRPKFGWD